MGQVQSVDKNHPSAMEITLVHRLNNKNKATYKISQPAVDGWRRIESGSGRKYEGIIFGGLAISVQIDEKTGKLASLLPNVVTDDIKVGDRLALQDKSARFHITPLAWKIEQIKTIEE
ncbi:hypothetical protein KKF61_06320 [Patescibacteria group bacterium]|nr:hypothetical protein [Patescibacteria group bacterium]MBU0964509.1 hypothetical protein [Patescibacteria group bacterium]